MEKMTFGLIVANRGFFPDHLAREGRQDIISVLESEGYGVVALDENESNCGAIETFAEAKKCADLFRKNRDTIDGIIVTHPNFGEEKGILETIKMARLDVPVLVQAEPDNPVMMTIENRRDSFCGKINNCNNLRQAGIPYTLTKSHCVSVKSEEFKFDLDDFASVCRIIKGLDNARFGAIGARPAAFNTVRYSEKLLEMYGITVETIDLSDVLGKCNKLGDADSSVKDKLEAIRNYTKTDKVPDDSLIRLAKFGVVIDDIVNELELDGTAIQCWTSLQENYGICSCTQMSMMGELNGKPSACEVDIPGLLGMYILKLAGNQPSALLDWNNNYGDDPDKCICFHCSNLPRSFFCEMTMDFQEIIAGSVGKENAFGTVVGRIKSGPATFCRLSTDDTDGVIKGYLGEGVFTDDDVTTFGGYGVMDIPNLQELLQFICKEGFEHHVPVSLCSKSEAVFEALDNYMGWEIYYHA